MTTTQGEQGGRSPYRRLRPFLPGLGVSCLGLSIVAGLLGWAALSGPFAVAGLVLLAVYVGGSATYSPFAFTVWVAAFVAAAMFFPLAFRTWFGYELKGLIVPLIQVIMFGMGTQLTVSDFRRVFAMPRAVIIGMVLQFSVMPFVGKGLAMLFTNDPEVAAGMVLIGACPGGVASNVMTYLANGNVALSVTMTSCSTLAAPLMTPAMTKLLAGTYVEVRFVAMMLSILNMIIIPIVAGLVVNAVLRKMGRAHPSMQRASRGIMGVLPFVSMFSICYIMAIITSLSRDQLLAGGFVVAILCAVILHNATGYVLGFWGARFFGLSESDSRTVAFEVGLQNAGMASGLSIEVLKSAMAAIPSAIFGSWMNMSGAMLASYWAGRPTQDAKTPAGASEIERPAID